MIDSHAHIYADDFNEDIEEVILRAKEAGVNKILLPNIDVQSIKDLTSLVNNHVDYAYPMIGLHPCSVTNNFKQDLAEIKTQFSKLECIAVGEIGIDLYWDKSTKDPQIEAFKMQCEWALELNLPIVIHSRDSIDLIIELLEENFKGKIRGVFHCFTGTIDQAQRIKDLGMYFGLGGVLTFKNSDLKNVVPHLPLERLLLETDSPYLAPVPYRGKRNEPAYMAEVQLYLAQLLNMDIKELDEQLEANTLQLFKI